MGTSLITIVGAKISGKGADKEHPYGHGRAEYLAAMIISFMIVFCGIELLRASVEKIIMNGKVAVNIEALAVLLISIPIKLWMWYYNKELSKRINSPILKAAAKDSISDVVATIAVILSTVTAPYLSFPIDGITGICISILIFKTGFEILKETIFKLIGTAPNEKLIKELEDILMEDKNIIGFHGLLIHDYGPECKIASVHAEVPENLSLVEAHDLIDIEERKIFEKLGVDIVIHIDPVAKYNKHI